MCRLFLSKVAYENCEFKFVQAHTGTFYFLSYLHNMSINLNIISDITSPYFMEICLKKIYFA